MGLPFDSDFLNTFKAEADEKLRNLGDGLITLEESGLDQDGLRHMFREAHTLKGSAGMMGLTSIKELAHKIEDIFSSAQKGQVELNQDITDLLLEAIDRIGELLPSGDEEVDFNEDVSGLLNKLDSVFDACPAGSGEKEAQSAAKEEKNDGVKAGSEMDETLEPADDNEEKPEAASHEAGDLNNKKLEPEAESKKHGGAGGHAKRSEPLEKRRPEERRSAEKGPQVAKKEDPTIRVNIDRLDSLLNLMGEIIVNQIGTEGKVHDLSSLKVKTQELKSMFNSLSRQVELLKESAVSDELEPLRQKLNKAGDTAAIVADELDAATAGLKESTAFHRMSLDELHEKALNVRMLPLSSIFNMYPRVIRDAARSSDKKVHLNISGGKTELDKRVLEQIADPMLHIIRNCVDHGIEEPEERRAAGKPEQGQISISASQRGDVVNIEIEDDGGGIDVDELKRKALKKGVIAESDNLTEDELLDLVFRPGLSTAKIITDISGRGVGMDVVKTNIEKLEGSVEIESAAGSGTKITVSLPVTLVVISGLLVKSGGTKFVIPMSAVQEMVAINRADVQSLGSKRGFIMREGAVPLIDLIEVLGEGGLDSGEEKSHVIIVSSGKHKLGIRVDELIGEQEVVIKPLGSFFECHPYVGGVTILASGEVVVVLNTYEIVSSVKEGLGAALGQGVRKTEDTKAVHRKILVVEDSLVVRELQRNILEAAGYDVDTAVDGEDALMHLEQGLADCVVTDIEMPGMNGFELTSAIRRTEDYKETPVIMVTSLSSEEHKKRGIEVGADAYVIKGTFDQQNLLDTIERLVA